MKKLTNGSPLDLWNSGDLLDYLDECIHDSQVVVSELIYATDNTDNKVDNVFTTSEFDTGLKVLIKEHKTTDLEKLKEVIKQLLYEGAVATQCHNHELINKNDGNPHKINKLHISGDVLLHYRYWGNNTLIISLELNDPLEMVQRSTKATLSVRERKFWADHIVSVLSENTSTIKISCHNYNDNADWFKGSILFSFPNILCNFQISVADDNLISSVDDIVYIVDFL